MFIGITGITLEQRIDIYIAKTPIQCRIVSMAVYVIFAKLNITVADVYDRS